MDEERPREEGLLFLFVAQRMVENFTGIHFFCYVLTVFIVLVEPFTKPITFGLAFLVNVLFVLQFYILKSNLLTAAVNV